MLFLTEWMTAKKLHIRTQPRSGESESPARSILTFVLHLLNLGGCKESGWEKLGILGSDHFGLIERECV